MSNEEVLIDATPGAIFFDDLEEAYLGMVEQKCGVVAACYDWEKCVEVLVGEGLDYDEAVEYLTFNTTEAYLGPHTPVFLYRPEPGE